MCVHVLRNFIYIPQYHFFFILLYSIVLVLPMTQRDGMGRKVGGGFRMGNTCIFLNIILRN